MTEKLKPCPFCGGKATLTEYRFAFYQCKVECTTFGCGISTMLYKGEKADKEAIKAWNRRTE